jgi:hypothetical protein
MDVFYHVPKCAGSTLRHGVYEQRVPEKRLLFIKNDISGDIARVNAMPAEEREALALIFGHMCFNEDTWFSSNADRMTVLRHPVQRVVSLYYYIARSKGHYLFEPVRRMSLADFVLSGITCTADNAMVRQLCGRDRFLQEPYNDMEIPYGEVTEGDLRTAIYNLSTFALVGVQEQFGDFVKQLCQRHNWPVPEHVRKNVKPINQRSDHSLPTLQIVEQVNQLDMELYTWVLENCI